LILEPRATVRAETQVCTVLKSAPPTGRHLAGYATTPCQKL
jgi:hypothetical protein